MGLDEEKTVLGDEIVSEEVKPLPIHLSCNILRNALAKLRQKV